MIDLTEDEACAAEYALGSLDERERAAAERRRAQDAEFAALIAQWEMRLAPLAGAIRPVVPPADIFARVLERLPGEPVGAPAHDNVLMMRGQIRNWRRVAGAASALAAILALWIVGREALPTPKPDQTYIAVLQHGADQPSFVVSFDLGNRKMTVMPLSTTTPPGKSYELWMIGADHAAPMSMGVIDAKAPMRPHLPDVDRGVLSAATYAVTLEPQGGSPNGKPTSAPVFVGKPMNMAL